MTKTWLTQLFLKIFPPTEPMHFCLLTSFWVRFWTYGSKSLFKNLSKIFLILSTQIFMCQTLKSRAKGSASPLSWVTPKMFWNCLIFQLRWGSRQHQTWSLIILWLESTLYSPTVALMPFPICKTGIRHNELFCCSQTESGYATQASLELLGSSEPPASCSQAGLQACTHAQPNEIFWGDFGPWSLPCPLAKGTDQELLSLQNRLQ